MRKSKVALPIILTSLLTACATKDSFLPKPKQSMKEVYSTHMQGVGSDQVYDRRSQLRRPMNESDIDLSSYVRTEKNQLQSKFKLLPNPTLYMFVAPHLASQDQVPIPGYLTEFKMWEKDHYAMPGEVSDMTSHFEGTRGGK